MSRSETLTALLEEYRAMYELAIFRMTALDRRVPVTAGVFGVAVASLGAIPVSAQALLFLATPPALLWLMRTTVNHARSFEDVLRRIEQLEDAINHHVGEAALTFQSTHPSRRSHIGGRTSTESVAAVLISVLLILLLTAYQILLMPGIPQYFTAAQMLLESIVALAALDQYRRLRQYRYTPAA